MTQEAPGMILLGRQVLTMAPAGVDPITAAPPAADLEALRARDAALVGMIEDGAVVWEGETIAWVGPRGEVPSRYAGWPSQEVPCVTPGWIDCHTHAVFAGSRHLEFTQRNLGADYLAIQEAGGGILSSARATAASSRRELAEALVGRCFEATRLGVTTLEVKSGYGLATDVELKQLQAIEDARGEVLLDLQATFLGAHAIPKRYREDRAGYVARVCEEMIPQVASRGLARFCDVFCDRGAFTVEEARRVLEAGLAHGLIPRLHADELSAAGAAELAVEVGAASADHLEHVSAAAMAGMASAGVVGVLLPGVNLFFPKLPRAPARELLMAGVEVALASDFNPGTSMTQDLGLVQTLGCTMLGMTPGECLRAVTRAAARALRLEDRGVLAPGRRADLTILGVEDYWQVPYVPGFSHVDGVVRGGELVYWRSAESVEDED